MMLMLSREVFRTLTRIRALLSSLLMNTRDKRKCRPCMKSWKSSRLMPQGSASKRPSTGSRRVTSTPDSKFARRSWIAYSKYYLIIRGSRTSSSTESAKKAARWFANLKCRKAASVLATARASARTSTWPPAASYLTTYSLLACRVERVSSEEELRIRAALTRKS